MFFYMTSLISCELLLSILLLSLDERFFRNLLIILPKMIFEVLNNFGFNFSCEAQWLDTLFSKLKVLQAKGSWLKHEANLCGV